MTDENKKQTHKECKRFTVNPDCVEIYPSNYTTCVAEECRLVNKEWICEPDPIYNDKQYCHYIEEWEVCNGCAILNNPRFGRCGEPYIECICAGKHHICKDSEEEDYRCTRFTVSTRCDTILDCTGNCYKVSEEKVCVPYDGEEYCFYSEEWEVCDGCAIIHSRGSRYCGEPGTWCVCGGNSEVPEECREEDEYDEDDDYEEEDHNYDEEEEGEENYDYDE